MIDLEKNCRIALIQAEPVMFDKRASLDKALALIDKASLNDPDIVVFPELFIPGYPIGMNFGFSMGKRTEEGRADWKRYYDASMVTGGPEFGVLAEKSKEHGIYLSLGFSERDAVSGTLYNGNVIFEPDGSYKVHRKLKPTGSERVLYGDADKGYFPVTETPGGQWEASYAGKAICLLQELLCMRKASRSISPPIQMTILSGRRPYSI